MTESRKASPLFVGWMVILGIVILIGVYTTYRLYTDGLGLLGLNDVVIWGLPTTAYIYLTGASYGLCVVSAIGIFFGESRVEPIAKRSVFLAIATMAGGFVALILHLGNPLSSFYMLLSPNPRSPFMWTSFFYVLYSSSLLAVFLLIHSGNWNGTLTRVFTLTALIAAIGSPSSVGAVFGLIAGRPGYAGAINALYIPLASLVGGVSLAILVNLSYHVLANGELTEEQRDMYNWLASLFTLVLAVLLLLNFWKTVVGLYDNRAGAEVFGHMVGTVAFQVQWWLGQVLPFSLMVIPTVRRTNGGKIVAAALALVGIFIGRLELVTGGLMVPVGPQAVEFPAFVEPKHTIWSWLVVVVSLGVALSIFSLGERYLNLDAAPEAAVR